LHEPHFAFPFKEQEAQIEAKDTNNWTALHYTARYGHLEVVKLLLDQGDQTEVKDTDNWTALCFASKYGHGAVVQLLAGKGADVKSPDSNGWMALFSAVTNGYEPVVKLLLEVGVNINNQEYGKALQAAVYNGMEALVHGSMEMHCSLGALKAT